MVGVVILVVGGLYLAACIWVAKRLTVKILPPIARSGAIAALVALFVALPHADAIWGYANFRRYCAEESRSEIYGSLVLPAQLFDTGNRPRFLDRFGNVNWADIKPYVFVTRRVDNDYAGINHLLKITSSLVRASDEEEIARWIDIHYKGGWLRTNGDGLGAGSCIADPPADVLLKQMLVIAQ